MARFMIRSESVASSKRISVQRIKQFPQQWEGQLDARRGSTTAQLIPAFFDNPVMSIADVERVAGPVSPRLYSALDRMEEVGIIGEITGRKRDRVWAAIDLMAELDDLDRRIAAAMSRLSAVQPRQEPQGVASAIVDGRH